MSPFMPTPPPMQPPMTSAVSIRQVKYIFEVKVFVLLILFLQIGLKHTAEPMEEEPQTKKLRTEDSLIPEQQFLARNKVLLRFIFIKKLLRTEVHTLLFQGPVQLNIAVPMMTEKAEWKLNGQTLNITLQVSDTVATMKALIHEQTGMPPGKQKLQYEV